MLNPLGDQLSGALQSNLVWRNQLSGENVVWQLDGTQFAFNRNAPQAGQDYVNLLSISDPDWEIKGTGDFNADQKDDAVWRNRRTGENVVWYLNDIQFAANPGAPQMEQDFDHLPALPDDTWEMQAIGDFNQDGWSDIVWRHQVTGDNVVWYLRNNQFIQNPTAPELGQDYDYFFALRDQNWQIKGAADFNADGFDDLLWRNQATGENTVWFLNNTQFVDNPGTPQRGQDFDYLAPIADRNWDIATTGHFNDDRQTDIVWRHKRTGENIVWLLNGTKFAVNPAAPQQNQDFVYLLTLPNQNWELVGSLTRAASLPEDSAPTTDAPINPDPPISPSNNPPSGTTFESAFELGAISGLDVVQESISNAAANDYYRFSVSTQQSINVLLNGLAANADLQLLDASGNRVKDAFGRDSKFNAGNAPEVRSRILDAGTYYLRVYGENVNTSYKLSILGLAATTDYIDRVVELTNFYRTQSDLNALVQNSALNNAAQGHSQAMALDDFFSHQGLNGSSPTQRAQAAGYAGGAGENIAAGHVNAEHVMEQWMYSAGHRDNILNANYQDIGVGYYYLADDRGTQQWRRYWTSLFGIPR